jgi:hypothetical protein
MRHKYTPQEIQFLRDIAVGHSYADIAELFNTHFALTCSSGNIKGALKYYSIRNGRDCKFQRGQASFNKGIRGVHYHEPTEFKPGHVPANHKPVGSERISVDGYIEMKIAEPRRWQQKHRVIWEAENGAVPKGYVVIFADGNKLNCSQDNLVLISRSQLSVINKVGLRYHDRETVEAAAAIADVKMAIAKAKRRLRR